MPFCALDFSDSLHVHDPGGKIKTGFYSVKHPSLLFLKLKTIAGILGKFNFTITTKVKSHGEFSYLAQRNTERMGRGHVPTLSIGADIKHGTNAITYTNSLFQMDYEVGKSLGKTAESLFLDCLLPLTAGAMK